MTLLKQAKSKISLILFAIYFCNAQLIFNMATASAQTMSNDNYILQLRDLDTNASEPTIDQSVIGVSDQQIPKKPQPKVKIQAAPFTFSISETLIYFGPLSPTNPITRSNKLRLSSGSGHQLGGYSVIGFEDRELSTPLNGTSVKSDLASAATIPDTSCDNGLCSQVSSAPWTSVLTYGFGYRCDDIVGSDCVTDFSDSTLYKQFANNSKNEIPQKVLNGTNLKTERIVQITYKVNIAGTQPKGSYSNTITYIAVPNF